VAQTNSTSLADIRILAQHLIYWRRAMAIPPLHHRDIYIASPNSDNHKLPAASLAWSKVFPLAPALPSFLATLSASPRPYKTFAPSKTHRPTYMEMLAWLLRGGWVVNLRTYMWIIVWPEIIYEVHHAIDAANIKKASEVRAAAATTSASSNSGEVAEGGAKKGDNNPLSAASTAESARLSRLTENLSALQKQFSSLPSPAPTSHPSMSNPPHIQHIGPYIIPNPSRAEHVESLYLEAIEKRLGDEKTTKAFKRFQKYCDGKTALEMVGTIEGLKRKEVWNAMSGFEEYLIAVRHW